MLYVCCAVQELRLLLLLLRIILAHESQLLLLLFLLLESMEMHTVAVPNDLSRSTGFRMTFILYKRVYYVCSTYNYMAMHAYYVCDRSTILIRSISICSFLVRFILIIRLLCER